MDEEKKQPSTIYVDCMKDIIHKRNCKNCIIIERHLLKPKWDVLYSTVSQCVHVTEEGREICVMTKLLNFLFTH